MEQVRPRLFVSRCLGFARCRWNGEVINDEFVKKLEPLADIVHECPEIRSLSEVYLAYEQGLRRALARPPRYTSLINVIQHAFGGFSDSLSKDERALFSNLIEQYRDERIPASVLLQLVRSWAVRFGESYLLRQVLFEPYPLSLVEITDSGKGRSN